MNTSIIPPAAPQETTVGPAPIGPLTAPTIPPSHPSEATPRGTNGVQSASQVEQLIQQAKTVWNTNMDQAQTLLEKAAVLAPQNFEAHFQLGRLLTQKQQYPAAIQEYQRALNINNRIPEAYFNLGYIHLIQGNYDLAIQHLEWCRALSPPYQDEVLTNIGIVYLRKKNPRQARTYFQEAIRLNPRNTVAREYLKKNGTRRQGPEEEGPARLGRRERREGRRLFCSGFYRASLCSFSFIPSSTRSRIADRIRPAWPWSTRSARSS